jgi:hypothetical protein
MAEQGGRPWWRCGCDQERRQIRRDTFCILLST